ncbi:HEPN domain-containing protein [Streptomyces sp. NPDC050418]|uniref:HEPN domain-containing protein n=1 Tax=Streptomyces sp. NPDC050418 TaxID=3365612 RepID=UPI0037AF40A5
MPRQKFIAQLQDVYELLDLADAIASRSSAVSYLPFKLSIQPFISGAVVLLCARFEEFLRDSVTYALDQHGGATPPISLTDLPNALRVHIVQQNMMAALQRNRYGVERSDQVRLAESLIMAQHYVAGRIWSDYAVDTGGNPGPDTVATLMKLIGVEAPWQKVGKEFTDNYQAPNIPGAINRSTGKPQDQLRQIVQARNTVAHSGTHLAFSTADVRFDVDFIAQLSGWIYGVLQKHVEEFAVMNGRVPAIWNPQ